MTDRKVWPWLTEDRALWIAAGLWVIGVALALFA